MGGEPEGEVSADVIRASAEESRLAGTHVDGYITANGSRVKATVCVSSTRLWRPGSDPRQQECVMDIPGCPHSGPIARQQARSWAFIRAPGITQVITGDRSDTSNTGTPSWRRIRTFSKSIHGFAFPQQGGKSGAASGMRTAEMRPNPSSSRLGSRERLKPS